MTVTGFMSLPVASEIRPAPPLLSGTDATSSSIPACVRVDGHRSHLLDPERLKLHGLTVDDIGPWELNEAFACQVLYCRDKPGIGPARYDVDGGGISIGDPYVMTGARLVGHALIEGKRRGARYVVVSMCVRAGWAQPACSKLSDGTRRCP